ncbi:DNA-directed RNA polymerase subunit beta [Klebsiella pneumoniae]|nr:DNA-directed RNA polymerase subunit beta [Klebsiella pneumoniae]
METGRGYVFRQLILDLNVCLISLAYLAIGFMICYSVLGEGKDPISILKPESWQAIIAKFTGK